MAGGSGTVFSKVGMVKRNNGTLIASPNISTLAMRACPQPIRPSLKAILQGSHFVNWAGLEGCVTIRRFASAARCYF